MRRSLSEHIFRTFEEVTRKDDSITDTVFCSLSSVQRTERVEAGTASSEVRTEVLDTGHGLRKRGWGESLDSSVDMLWFSVPNRTICAILGLRVGREGRL